MSYLNKSWRNKKEFDRMIMSQRGNQTNHSKDRFGDHTYTDINEDSESIFKWWLAPSRTKLKQENYNIIRQIDHIKELKKEARKLKRDSIISEGYFN